MRDKRLRRARIIRKPEQSTDKNCSIRCIRCGDCEAYYSFAQQRRYRRRKAEAMKR